MIDLLSMHRHVLRREDANLDMLLPFNVDDLDNNLVSDSDRLANVPRED